MPCWRRRLCPRCAVVRGSGPGWASLSAAGRRVGGEGARTVLDALLVTAALLAVSSGAVLGPVLDVSAGSGLATAALLAPPIGDVVLGTLALLLLSRAPAGHRGYLALVGT